MGKILSKKYCQHDPMTFNNFNNPRISFFIAEGGTVLAAAATAQAFGVYYLPFM